MNLKELRELAEKAAPGPWEASDRGDYSDFDGHSRVISGDDRRLAVVQHDGSEEADATSLLMAASRTTTLALLDLIDELAGALEESDAAVQVLRAFIQTPSKRAERINFRSSTALARYRAANGDVK